MMEAQTTSGADSEASPTTWEYAAKQAAQQILGAYEKQRDVFAAAHVHAGEHLAWIERDVALLSEMFSEDAAPQEPRPLFVSVGVAVLAHMDSNFIGAQGLNPRFTLGAYVADVCDVLARKQHDYGHDSIAAFGARGITVRLSDKLGRLRNLERRGVAANETIEDTWLDLFGYAVIGVMWEDQTFGLPLAADVDPETGHEWAGLAASTEVEGQTEYEDRVLGDLRAESMARHPSNDTAASYTPEDEQFVLGVVQEYCDGLELEHQIREIVRDELGHAAESRRQAIRHGHGILPYVPPVPPQGGFRSGAVGDTEPDVSGRDIDPLTRYKFTAQEQT